MCIVIYIPEGKEIPLEHLETSHYNNEDGAGFMYVDLDGNVVGHKGYMEYQELITDLTNKGFIKGNTLCPKLPFAIHFRMATHGGVSPGKCHPFPASKDKDELHSLDWTHEFGVAHNGIMGQFAKPGLSDTQGFIQDVLSDVELLRELPENEALKSLLSKVISSSKFIVMDEKNVLLFGNWLEVDGVFYSNDGYKDKWRYTYDFRKTTKSSRSTSASDRASLVYGACDYCGQYGFINEDKVCEKCEEIIDAEAYPTEHCVWCNDLIIGDTIFLDGDPICESCYEFYDLRPKVESVGGNLPIRIRG